MLGEQVVEEKGKTTNIRVISVDGGPKMEVCSQTTGEILGVNYTGLTTYWAAARPDGFMYGEGEGVLTTQDGEVVTWKGQGAGKSKGIGSAASWRGAVYYQTSSKKLSKLNGIACVFEYEVDENGNSHGKLWEWK